MHWPGGLCIAQGCENKEKSLHKRNWASGILYPILLVLLVLFTEWLECDNLSVLRTHNGENDSSTSFSDISTIAGCV